MITGAPALAMIWAITTRPPWEMTPSAPTAAAAAFTGNGGRLHGQLQLAAADPEHRGVAVAVRADRGECADGAQPDRHGPCAGLAVPHIDDPRDPVARNSWTGGASLRNRQMKIV